MSISIGSDTLITLVGLYDNLSQTFMNAAAVNGKILDGSGNVVASFSMPYVTASSGDYQASIPASTTATLADGQPYVIAVTATVAGNTLLVEHSDYATVIQV